MLRNKAFVPLFVWAANSILLSAGLARGEPGESPAAHRRGGLTSFETMSGSGERGGDGATFASLGLDPRVVKAGTKKGWRKPTRVQIESIPPALKGQDVVVQAATGSGKTASYVMPMVDALLSRKVKGGDGWRALVLVPTRELSEQVREETESILSLCGSSLEATTISSVSGENMKGTRIASIGDIIVSTPGQIKMILEKKKIPGEKLFSKLQTLVLDEADLLLSYGYEKDLEFFSVYVPQSCQCSLFCATMTDDMEKLNKLVCTNPSVIQVSNATDQAGGKSVGNASLPTSIDHYRANCKASDKLLNLTCLLKLGLVEKKVLIFVNTIDTGYRVRLFLEHFGIKSAVLNAELPLNSRHNIIKHFNKGNFDFLIATDIDKAKSKASGAPHHAKTLSDSGDGGGRNKTAGKSIDTDFGVVRGIDFQGVRTVVNYDMSKTVEGYIHRVGRTGRAGSKGICISLLTEGDRSFFAVLDQELRGGEPEAGPSPGEAEPWVKPFAKLTPSLVDSLRYRGQDVARAVSRSAVQEARAKELRMEILNSSKLKAHFQANPEDEVVLKHDATLSTSVPTHLKHIPKYMKEPSSLLRKKNNRGRPAKKINKKKKGKSAMDVLKETVSSGGAG